MKKTQKNNILNFPTGISDAEREVEAILFASSQPLDVSAIENKISKKANVQKILNNLQKNYIKRGINLIYY